MKRIARNRFGNFGRRVVTGSQRVTAWLLVWLFSIGGISSCLSGCKAQTTTEQPVKRTANTNGSYFGLAYYENGPLCPVTDNTEINRLLCEALYEGLFEVGETFTAVPVLCEDYQTDGMNFVFQLKPNIYFWSGERMTARDVVASLQTAMYNEDSPYHSRMAEIDSIETVDDTTVRLSLTSPNINFPRLLDIPIYREGTEEQAFADGTGPFRPVEEGNDWKLVANENWNGGIVGSIREILLVPITRPDAAVFSFQTGDISLVREPRIASNPAALSGAMMAVSTPTADIHYLGINHAHGQLAIAKVRQALSAAIDRKSICETQLQAFADPAVLPVNPQPTEDELAIRADTEHAKQLLEEAELESTLSFKLLVNEDNAFKAEAADAIAAAWTAAGISVTVEKQPYEVFEIMVSEGDFDVYYGETLLTPDFDLRPLVSTGGKLNYGKYDNETLSEAITASRRGEESVSFYQLFAEEMPFIPLAFERNRVGVRLGLIDAITPTPYNAFAGVEHWTTQE